MVFKTGALNGFMVTSKEHFNNVASIYLKEDGARIHKHHALRKAHVISSLVKKGDRILDTGCGVGEYLASIGYEAHGADFSKEMVKISSQRSSGPVYIADATHLPFKDSSFDIIYSVGLLHHLKTKEKVKQAMEEFSRVSRREVLVFDLNPNNPFCRYVVCHICPWDEGDERVPPKSEVLNAANETGMDCLSVDYMGFLPYGTPRGSMHFASKIEEMLERTVPKLATSIIYRFKVR